MYGNATSNDCSIAAIASLEQVWNAELGDGGNILPQAPLVATYNQLVGGKDTGVYPSQAFIAWEKGIDGQRIAKVSPIASDMSAVERAVWQLGGIYAIVNITGSDIQHPNVPTSKAASISPWSLSEAVRPGAFGPIPHAVAVVGYDRSYVYLATWGSVQPVTWGMVDTASGADVVDLARELPLARHEPNLSGTRAPTDLLHRDGVSLAIGAVRHLIPRISRSEM